MTVDPDRFLSGRIAVVGASPKNGRFGGYIYRILKQKGYSVVPVNPHAATIDHDHCYAALDRIPGQIDLAIVAVRPENAASVVNDAIAAEVPRIWFQQGADFSEIEQQAKLAGIETISGKCVIMHARPVTGLHAVHRFVSRLFGRV